MDPILISQLIPWHELAKSSCISIWSYCIHSTRRYVKIGQLGLVKPDRLRRLSLNVGRVVQIGRFSIMLGSDGYINLIIWNLLYAIAISIKLLQVVIVGSSKFPRIVPSRSIAFRNGRKQPRAFEIFIFPIFLHYTLTHVQRVMAWIKIDDVIV